MTGESGPFVIFSPRFISLSPGEGYPPPPPPSPSLCSKVNQEVEQASRLGEVEGGVGGGMLFFSEGGGAELQDATYCPPSFLLSAPFTERE